MDNLSSREMDALSNKYDEFYRFANLLERFAQVMAEGRRRPSQMGGWILMSLSQSGKSRNQKKVWLKMATSSPPIKNHAGLLSEQKVISSERMANTLNEDQWGHCELKCTR